jgi:hypothetical protein
LGVGVLGPPPNPQSPIPNPQSPIPIYFYLNFNSNKKQYKLNYLKKTKRNKNINE